MERLAWKRIGATTAAVLLVVASAGIAIHFNRSGIDQHAFQTDDYVLDLSDRTTRDEIVSRLASASQGDLSTLLRRCDNAREAYSVEFAFFDDHWLITIENRGDRSEVVEHVPHGATANAQGDPTIRWTERRRATVTTPSLDPLRLALSTLAQREPAVAVEDVLDGGFLRIEACRAGRYFYFARRPAWSDLADDVLKRAREALEDR